METPHAKVQRPAPSSSSSFSSRMPGVGSVAHMRLCATDPVFGLDAGEHLIRYYGWYSNKNRGQRVRGPPPATAASTAAVRAPTAREARKRLGGPH
jgi:hypothetical protein